MITRRNMLHAGGGLAALMALGRLPALAAAKSLNILDMNTVWAHSLATSAADAYKAKTGVEVTAEENPYEAVYSKLLVEMTQGSSTYDMLTTDGLWIRQFINGGWAVALEDIKAKNPSLPDVQYGNLAPNSLLYVTLDGKHYGLPMSQSTPIMAYRKDLFEKAGIEKAPTNWDEYVAAAKKIHSSATAGTVLLAGGADAFASGDFDSRLMGMVKLDSTEDGFINAKNEPVFNSEGQGVRALERLKEITPYCLRGFENFDYADGSSALQSGAVGMMITWSDMMVGIEDGPLKGKFGYALAPTEKFEQQAVAGNEIFISKFSENQEEAYRFLAWMSEGDGYRFFSKDGEGSLVLQSDIDRPDITEKVPMLAAFKQFKPRGTSAIPCQFFRLNNAVEAQRVLYEELVAGLLGKKSTKQAIADAEKRVADVARKS